MTEDVLFVCDCPEMNSEPLFVSHDVKEDA
jgi:hypothetical protein